MMTGFTQSLFQEPPAIDVTGLPPGLRVGTSSWSCQDWRGTLYSPSARPSDFIAEYARQLPTVEIDSTFYGIPAEATVRSWRTRTPPGFLFSAKAPQSITHDRRLVNDVFVYFNNHFAGHAPGSIRLFLDLLREGGPEAARREPP